MVPETEEDRLCSRALDPAHMGCTDGVTYAVAKAGVIHFCRCLALDLRPHGVRAERSQSGPTKTARFLVTRPIDQRWQRKIFL